MATSGCLSTPGPATGGDGGGDDDGGIDAPSGMPRCRSDARPTGQAWPPPGITVRLAQIADIDGDAVNDLVVSAAPETAGVQGKSAVYVLYGPVSPQAPQFHVELDLDNDAVDAEVVPWAMSLDDVDGDSCLDLTVMGPPTFSNVDPRVAVWRHAGTAAAWTGPATRASLDFTPVPGPVMVTWGQLSLSPSYDLVVADLNNVQILGNSSLESLGNPLTVTPPQPCGGWDNINALALQPRSNGRVQLLVFGHYRTNTVAVEDNGDVTVSAECFMQQRPQTRGTTRVDLDGNPPFDLISGSGGILGIHMLDGTNPPVSPMMGLGTCAATPRGSDGYIEGFAAGDMGGTAAPDVVIIDYDNQSSSSWACLVNAIAYNTTDGLTANGTDEFMVTGNQLRTEAVGDVGGGVRAWLFEVDGTLHCLKRNPGLNVLERC